MPIRDLEASAMLLGHPPLFDKTARDLGASQRLQ
jgi:hypothetical protein